MHVVTFYSFKGGTGRSMALVNVAVELVRAGRRVLIVDFDLEAPGLDTFNLPQPKTPSKGIVDYVLEYEERQQAPDVSSFIYKSPVLPGIGELWIMPSGLSDGDYDERFKSIDWQDLYENHDGYLLFEDLRAQWDTVLKPDYVLIDSRTGHTDVGGICTRQLPDSVLLFFFPNEQNRRGLDTIVKQIRAETSSERVKNATLHFVMSNVPELDDEEGLLEASILKFKETLSFRDFAGVIHHYPSLSLLTQSVFTLDRPKTRLAQEYKQLAKTVRRGNIEDPDAALEFLNELTPARLRRFSPAELEKRIGEIRQYHSGNIDVLISLATLLRRQRRFAEAVSLLEEAGELGAKSAEFLLVRAELRHITKDSAAAIADILSLLNSADATYAEVSAAARLLLQLAPSELPKLVDSTSFHKLDLDGKYYVAAELFSSRLALRFASSILKGLLEAPEIAVSREFQVRRDLTFALIGKGDFEQASSVITNNGKLRPVDLDSGAAFDYAMTDWGLKKRPDSRLFARVVELDDIDQPRGPAALQRSGLALWVSGNSEKAGERLTEAQQHLMTRPMLEFSSWSYLKLGPDAFFRDLREMLALTRGESLVPIVFREEKDAPSEMPQ
jgi:MinD-like ATPase involved in chromosome partitioning or flagellar assembly